MLYRKNDSVLYFTRIPRTASRTIHYLLKENGYRAERPGYELLYGNQVMHLTREYFEFYYSDIDFDSIPVFTCMRDPVTRFRSASTHLKKIGITETELENYFQFLYCLDHKPVREVIGATAGAVNVNLYDPYITRETFGVTNFSNNWFKPQHEFLRDNTHVWLFENGINSNFTDWLNQSYNLDLKYYDVKYHKADYDTDERINLTESIVRNIQKYYEKDYEIIKQGINL